MISANEIKDNIESLKSKVNSKDFNFYNITFLHNLAVATEKEAIKCQECVGNMELSLTLSRNFPELLSRGQEGKKELEETVDKITKHLEQKHSYSKKGWYRPLYTLYGLLLGILISVISIFFTENIELRKILFSIITSVIMITGHIIGSVKDRRQLKSGKIL